MFSFIGFVGAFGILLGLWYWFEQRKANWKLGMVITIFSTIVCISGFGMQNLYPVIFAEEIKKQKESYEETRKQKEQEYLKEEELENKIADYIHSKHDVKDLQVIVYDKELSISAHFDSHKGYEYLMQLSGNVLYQAKNNDVIDEIRIMWQAPVPNYYGHKEDTAIMNLDISMDEVNKINFDNFELGKFKYISNFYSYTNEDGEVVDAYSKE